MDYTLQGVIPCRVESWRDMDPPCQLSGKGGELSLLIDRCVFDVTTWLHLRGKFPDIDKGPSTEMSVSVDTPQGVWKMAPLGATLYNC